MQKSATWSSTVLAILIGSSGAIAQTSKPGVTSRPASRPARDAAALALGRKVAAFAGGSDGWAKVHNIAFTFLGRRRLLWDRRTHRVRVEMLGRPAKVLLYDIRQDDGLGLGNGRIAKAAWINDFYWLLVPLKVLDPGVRLSIDDRQKGDPKDVVRLHLRFDHVGMTPKNEYVLHVDSKTGRVLRWDYFARAGATPRSWKFAGYTKIGPLMLSLERPGKKGVFRLSDVVINGPIPDKAWSSPDPLLQLPAPRTRPAHETKKKKNR